MLAGRRRARAGHEADLRLGACLHRRRNLPFPAGYGKEGFSRPPLGARCAIISASLRSRDRVLGRAHAHAL